MTIQTINNPPKALDWDRIAADAQHFEHLVNDLTPADLAAPGGASRPNIAKLISDIQARYGSINYVGAWATATSYVERDVYTSAGVSYIVLVNHTSSTVAADLAAGRTAVYQGLLASDLADPTSGKGADYVANADRSFATVSDLQAFPKPSLAAGRTLVVCVQEAVSGSGFGTQRFRWQGNSNQAADGYFIINPTGNAGSGRWVTLSEQLTPAMAGAWGDDAHDDQVALNLAMSSAKTLKKRVYIEPGVYRHSGTVSIDSVIVSGAGVGSELKSTDTSATNPSLNLQLTGVGVKLLDCKVTTTWAGGRQSNTASQGVSLVNASEFEVARVHVVGAGGAGILGQLSTDGFVHHCTVESTLADGIHFTNASFDIRIFANKVYLAGDDSIALVAYNSGGFAQSARACVFGNICVGDASHISNGVDVVGWSDVDIFGNYAENMALSAVAVQSQSAYTTYNPFNILVTGNVAKNCGQAAAQNFPQYLLYSSGGTYSASGVTFANNRAHYSAGRQAQAFRANGLFSDCSLRNLFADGTAKITILNSTLTRFVIDGCEAHNFADGVYDISGSSGDLTILRGIGRRVFATPSLSRYINVNSCGGITSLTVNDHTVDQASFSLIAGDSTVATIRPYTQALRNYGLSSRVPEIHRADSYSAGTYILTLPVSTDYIERTFVVRGTAPVSISFTNARHQCIEVRMKLVQDSNPGVYQMLRQRWIYTSAAGIGTAGVDYVDTGGGNRYQRTDVENFNAGSVGAWTMTFSTPTVTATFTPSASSHLQIAVEAVYKAA